MRYKYWLIGSTGQIGRYLLPELEKRGTVTTVDPRKTMDWPKAQHIVNAGGHTNLAGVSSEPYWDNNIMLAVSLAHFAKAIGAQLHQLSSVAVAEFRPTVLTEADHAVPDIRQLTYSKSKVLMELAVEAVLPTAKIYRLGDVVPPLADLNKNWRRNHWLPILFSYGKIGFSYAPSDYGVWLSTTNELADAVVRLLEAPGRRYHVLGNTYYWGDFLHAAKDLVPRTGTKNTAKWMTDIVLHGPEASDVTDTETVKILRTVGFEQVSELAQGYWQAFAARSLIR